MTASSAFWRHLAYAGARYGPTAWVRYSPSVFGLAFAAALPQGRAIVRENLRAVLGSRGALAEHLDVARTFVSFAHCLAESLAADRPEAAGAVRDVSGRQVLRDALAKGHGAIIVTAHAGVWDAAARLLGEDHSVRVALVMLPEVDARARALHDAVRLRAGVTVVHVGGHPLDALPLLRHLRSGGVVAIQIDRLHPRARGIVTQLFGRSFTVPQGPFELGMLTGAPVIPVFAARRGYFDYVIDIGRPLWLARRASREDQRHAAQDCVGALERFVRRHPTQWFHFAGLMAKSQAA